MVDNPGAANAIVNPRIAMMIISSSKVNPLLLVLTFIKTSAYRWKIYNQCAGICRQPLDKWHAIEDKWFRTRLNARLRAYADALDSS